jgi:hypothetical protein
MSLHDIDDNVGELYVDLHSTTQLSCKQIACDSFRQKLCSVIEWALSKQFLRSSCVKSDLKSTLGQTVISV